MEGVAEISERVAIRKCCPKDTKRSIQSGHSIHSLEELVSIVAGGNRRVRLPDHSRLRFLEHVQEDSDTQACQQMD